MLIYYLVGSLIIIISFLLLFKKELVFLSVGLAGKRRVEKKIYKLCLKKDYLIINELHFPISGSSFRYIDTLIFGDKYLYLIKIIKQAGEVEIAPLDNRWRIIYAKTLTNIDNPLHENEKRINRILEVVPGIKKEDIKSVVVFTKTCTFNNYINEETSQYVVKEDDLLPLIDKIEYESKKEIIPSEIIEKYASSFYAYGKKAEELISKQKK